MESSASDRIDFVKTLLLADPSLGRKQLIERGKSFGLHVLPSEVWKARVALGLSSDRAAARRAPSTVEAEPVEPWPADASAPAARSSVAETFPVTQGLDVVLVEPPSAESPADASPVAASRLGDATPAAAVADLTPEVPIVAEPEAPQAPPEPGRPRLRRAVPTSSRGATESENAILRFAEAFEALHAEVVGLRAVVAAVRAAVEEVG